MSQSDFDHIPTLCILISTLSSSHQVCFTLINSLKVRMILTYFPRKGLELEGFLSYIGKGGSVIGADWWIYSYIVVAKVWESPFSNLGTTRSEYLNPNTIRKPAKSPV